MDLYNSTSFEDYAQATSLPSRILLSLITLCISLLGLAGNAVVIYATIRYVPFKMDSVSITLIRHIAVSDMLFVLVQVLPNSIAHLTGGYYFGDTFCRVVGMIRYIPIVGNMSFIMVISTYRLFTLLSPFSAMLMTKQSADILSICIWLLSAVPSAVFLASDADTFFDADIAICDVGTDHLSPGLFYSLMILFIILPFIIIVCSNVIIWAYVVRMIKKMQRSTKQACMTSAIICSLFAASWAPNIILYAVPSQSTVVWNRVAVIIFSMNTVMNPMVYTVVNRSFKEFLVKWVSPGRGRSVVIQMNKTSYHENSTQVLSLSQIDVTLTDVV